MNEVDTSHAAPAVPRFGLRLRLSLVFVVVSLIIAGFITAAVRMQRDTVERAARLEAEHVASVIAHGAVDGTTNPSKSLQRYVEALHARYKRDVVVVDANKKGIADANTEEIGRIYDADTADEVARTIRDGLPRSFVEKNELHPAGAKQIVVPMRGDQASADSPIVGAVILEYTPMEHALLAAENESLVQITMVGAACVLASLLFGLRAAAKLARRLHALHRAVGRVANGDYDARIAQAPRGDELDLLGAMFNRMASVLSESRERLLRHGQDLEKRVAVRTEELSLANLQLLREIEEREQAQVAMRESEERYRKLFELSADGMLVHVDGVVAQVNSACVRLLGASGPEAIVGRQAEEIVHPDYRDTVRERVRLMNRDLCTAPLLEEKLLRTDGSAFDAEVMASSFTYRGKVAVHVIFRDITERKRAEERMAYLAQYDSLTGLPNRNLFRDRLSLAMARARRSGKPLALMFLDLDRFKEINDTLGHSAGDEVLQAAATLLRASLRDVDTIARLGGDEFTVILENVMRQEDASLVAEKIKRALSEPIAVGGREIFLSASIGIALYPNGAGDVDTLLRHADIAMYQAKGEGRNTHALYAPEMSDGVGTRLSMESLLRRAIDRQEFELHYQPKVDLETGKIAGVEALIRWNSKELGPVSPMRFIPVAEETGLIVAIGEWVLRTACEQLKTWRDQGLRAPTMAVNFSPRQLRQKDAVAGIARVLDAAELDPGQLEIEITEGQIVEDIGGSVEKLKAMRKIGVSLAIDDFGTGYSSLSYLTKLPVQTLKIDRSFVATMKADGNAMTLVSAIISLARSLRMKVVAEGVESEEQASLLHRLDCDEMQGYYISRPIPAVEMGALLARDAVYTKHHGVRH